MPSYEKWIRRAKNALKEKKQEVAEDIKSRLSHTPELWERVMTEFEQENKPAAKPVDKPVVKKTTKVKKNEK
jgi:hypothetical protein